MNILAPFMHWSRWASPPVLLFCAGWCNGNSSSGTQWQKAPVSAGKASGPVMVTTPTRALFEVLNQMSSGFWDLIWYPHLADDWVTRGGLVSAYEFFCHLVLGMSKSASCGYLNFQRTPGSRFRSFEHKTTSGSVKNSESRTSGSAHFKSIKNLQFSWKNRWLYTRIESLILLRTAVMSPMNHPDDRRRSVAVFDNRPTVVESSH